MSAYIRPVQPSDDEALSRICLLTGAAGSSAEGDYSIPEILGLVFALPYNNRFETTFGFVLVDAEESSDGTGLKECVVGYILGTADTERFEALSDEKWRPSLRERFPQGDYHSRTPADTRLINSIHTSSRSPAEITSRYAAHIHIDILPSHQRKSWGRKLMISAVDYLKERGRTGLFVGLDPKNEDAKRFYAKLGFKRIDREGGEWWGLDFDQFT